MKKLLLILPVALMACTEEDAARLVPDLFIASPEGAGFGPYSKAEYDTRVDDNQTGTRPYSERWIHP